MRHFLLALPSAILGCVLLGQSDIYYPQQQHEPAQRRGASLLTSQQQGSQEGPCRAHQGQHHLEQLSSQKGLKSTCKTVSEPPRKRQPCSRELHNRRGTLLDKTEELTQVS